jgi:dihydroneopterin aldolase
MEGPPRKLVEALTEEVAAEILRAFPLVRTVGVEIVKLKPPVDFASAGFAVRICRARGGN